MKEVGDITLIGEASRALDDASLKELEADLKKYCSSVEVSDCNVRAGVERLPLHKVFISSRTQTHRQRELQNIISLRTARWGLEPISVLNRPGRSVLSEVEREIRDSAGLLQLISFSKEETDELGSDPSGPPDLQWLLYEYGYAGGLGVPRVRLVETSKWNLEQWREYLRINRDEYLLSFSFSDDPEEIAEVIDVAFKSLAREIANRSVVGRMNSDQ